MEDNDMQYDFKKFPKRGLVYIIVNEKFTSEGYPDRLGAYTDYKNMKKLFKPLKLKLMTFYDKTAKQIKDILNDASNRPDLAERSCFICIISSHGEQWSETHTGHMSRRKSMEHAIVGIDGMRVLTKDLVDLFSEDKCPHLREKPKLFFIQACRESVYSTDRSEALDSGVNVQYIVSAKVSKYRRMRTKLSTNTNFDSSDNKPEQSDVPFEALDEIIGTGPGGKDTEEEEEEEEDQFSDGYDTATTDNDSGDEDRETGHDDVRNRDRSSYTKQYKGVVPEGDVLPGIQHIEAITPEDTPTDQADAGGRKPRVDTSIQEIESVEVTAIPCHDDMLVMFASPPGKLAWRSTTEGGWLLANLYNVFKHYIRNGEICHRDFLTLLTEVSQDVSLKETNTDDPKYNAMKMTMLLPFLD
ncbi:Caspase-3 [Mizuhopecten yessoensis]|uniref:Caspase-3 n=1 Tax=Mizuhopecten yessoensis TaxID=6573 RepID=A0A210PZ02_MIZYE|nr:Caspase-3 [Mizuhopecten yessoensis]